jgi:hypothetical protein
VLESKEMKMVARERSDHVKRVLTGEVRGKSQRG